MLCFVSILCLVLMSAIPSITSITPAVFLTSYINKNQIAEARNLSAVNASLFLNVTSYSGFLTIDETYNSNTFFWYFPVKEKPLNDTPWIIWLQGGPGGSSLSGLFDEMGPFEYDAQLKLRNSSWCQEFSMVFLDNPVGAGFSFTDSKLGFVTNMSTYADHLYNALQQLMTIYPELKTAPLYIAGESYAGRYVPAFAEKILDMKKTPGHLDVNFKGVMMGNPVLNREDISDFTALFYRWGLIDSQGMQAAQPLQDKYFETLKKKDAAAAKIVFDQLLDKLTEISNQNNFYNVLNPTYDLHAYEKFLDKPETRDALHVGNIKFTFSNESARLHLVSDFLSEVDSKVEKLLDHEYPVLIYCGQLDLMAQCVNNANARRQKWHWSGREDFLKASRYPWTFNGTDVGFVKSGGYLTEVLIRGSGHLVPIDTPYEAQHLISNFIKGFDLQKPINFESRINNTPQYKTPSEKENLPPSTVQPSIVHYYKVLIASLVINVILIIVVLSGVFYYVRRKRRSEIFYASVDNISDEIFMS